MNSKTAEDFILGALIGGAIGAATALMLAPLSGHALRNKIVNGFPYHDILIKSTKSRRPSRRPTKRTMSALNAYVVKKRKANATHAHKKPNSHSRKSVTGETGVAKRKRSK